MCLKLRLHFPYLMKWPNRPTPESNDPPKDTATENDYQQTDFIA